MTSYEIETASVLGRKDTDSTFLSKALVPLVAAALVVLLGLVFIGLTPDDGRSDTPFARPPAGDSAR